MEKDTKVLLFDTETTGFYNSKLALNDPKQQYMIQLSAYLIEPGVNEPIDGITIAVKPDGWVMPQDLVDKLGHGMSTQWLTENGSPAVHAAAHFQDLMRQCNLISSFGINFDIPVIKNVYMRLGWEGALITISETSLFCVMKMAIGICKIPPTPAMLATGRKHYKTPNLAEAYSIILNKKLVGAHDAKNDTLALIEIFNWMYENNVIQMGGSSNW